MYVISLHSNHRHVSATHVAIFRVVGKVLSIYILRFYKNTDINSLKKTHKKGWKHIGILVF